MVNIVHSLPVTDWSPRGAGNVRELLEGGQVPYFPGLGFEFSADEKKLFSDRWCDGKSKNIALRPGASEVRGASGEHELLHGMLARFARFSRGLVEALAPGYAPHLIPGGTSFRPAEIRGRKTSWRKDDTRLHVDAFPSNPTRGQRLLRIFTNVNPDGAPRAWRVGEPFADFTQKFLPRLRAAPPGWLPLLHALGVTKRRRSTYDHMMLQLHDTVKADADYQKNAPQQSFDFPPGSTWMVFSDQVLHAAMAGQFMLEQTFYLPPEATDHAPLRVLEKLCGRGLL